MFTIAHRVLGLEATAELDVEQVEVDVGVSVGGNIEGEVEAEA